MTGLLIISATVLAIACAPTNYGALSIPMIAIALTLISRQRRGNDVIPEFYALLAGIIIVSCLLTGLLLIGKRFFSIV